MKYPFKSLSFAVLFSFALFSCQKEEYQSVTLNQEAKANQSYTIALPITDDNYAITTAPSHASESTISKDANGNPVYIYTATAGYVGTDQVVLTTNHDNQMPKAHNPNMMGRPHKGKGKGNCDKSTSGNTEDDYIVTININVTDVVAPY